MRQLLARSKRGANKSYFLRGGSAAGGSLMKSAPGGGAEALAAAVANDAVELELDDEQTGCRDRLRAREG